MHIVLHMPVQWPCRGRTCSSFGQISASHNELEPKYQCPTRRGQWSWKRWTKISYGSCDWCLPPVSCLRGISHFCSCSDKLWVANKEGAVHPFFMIWYVGQFHAFICRIVHLTLVDFPHSHKILTLSLCMKEVTLYYCEIKFWACLTLQWSYRALSQQIATPYSYCVIACWAPKTTVSRRLKSSVCSFSLLIFQLAEIDF